MKTIYKLSSIKKSDFGVKSLIMLIGLLLIANCLKAQTYNTNGGKATWTASGTGFTEATLYTTGTGLTHGDAFDGVMTTTVTGTSITSSTSLHYSSTYAVAIQQVVITNSGGSASTYTLSVIGGLGSDASTYWHYSSTSGSCYTISSDNASSSINGSDPVVSFLYGTANAGGSVSMSLTNGSDAYTYNLATVSIAAGATHRYLFLVGLGDIDDQSYNRPDQAYSAVSSLQNVANWPADFTSYLTGTQMAQVKNWQILAGDNCNTAVDLGSLTSPFSGTTVGYADDISTCRNGYPDRIFYLDVPNNYQVDIWQSDNSYDSYHYLGYGASCPGTQIYCVDDPDTQHNTWSNTSLSTQRVWYIQDGFSGSGTFTLNWTLTNLCTAPTISTHPSTSTQNLCVNGSASALSVVAGGTSPNYQWYSNTSASNSGGSSISGATSSSYTPPTTVAGTKYYYCYVSNGCGNATSNVSGALSISPASVGGTASVTSATLCSGSGTTVSVSGYTGTIQWQQSANGSSGWANVAGGSGATTATYTTPNLTSTTYYRAVVTSGVCGAANSTTATVTVSPTSVGGTATAAAATICTGSTTTITLSSYTGTIQWQQSANGSTGWANVTGGSGATSATYTTPALSAATYYRAVVTSGVCSAANSTTASVAISATSVGGTATAGSSSVCSGSGTTVSVSGYTGTIQWQQSANGSSGWANVAGGSGATTATYTTPNLTSTTYYRAVVTSGVCGAANSTTATVTVSPTSVGGTATATAATICTGSTTTITVSSSTGTIQWQQSANGSTGWANVTGGSGATSATYTTPALSAATYYRAVVTSGVCSAANSTTASVAISATSVGGAATAGSSSVCTGNSTTVSVSGYTGTIQWQQSANGSTGWANATGGSGATTATYTTPNLTSTTYYRAVVTSGVCGAANSTTASVTVNALPTVASITGTTTVCSSFTTTLSCATASGVWSSNSANATVNSSSGVVTGVSAGSATISYTVTNGTTGCSNASTAAVTVNASLAAPTSVTATPSSIQSGQSSNLNATSTGNTVYWYTSATGGSASGSSASGTNFSVSPTVTTTYYAEANSTQSFYINTLTATNSSVTDHNSYTGDDRGGIAVTPSYYYYTGDNYTVRYNMPGLTNPLSCTRRDGLFSDLGTGTLYTLHNGTTDPVYGGSTMSPFAVTNFRTMGADLTIGASAAVTLSQTVNMSSGSAAIYAGSNFVILQNGTSFYRVDIPSGTVTSMGTYTINRYGSESWATWGVAELNNGVYSVLYRENSSNTIKRLNLSTGTVSTLATFTNLSDMCSFTYSPANSRWYFHYEGSAQFGGTAESAGYADGTHTITSTGCPSATRTAVTVTVANPPTVTTAAITDINATTATGGGNVTNQGGAEVTVRGVCWSTSQNPTISNSKTSDGTGTGSFTSSITGLTVGTLYYVRAYATNSIGTSYGSQVSFTSYAPGTIAGSQTICTGANPSMFTSSAAAVGMPSVTYQWQTSANNVTFSDISGATSTTYQSGAIGAQTYFRRNATSGSVTLSSNVITVSMDASVSAPTAVTASPATILSGGSSNLNATVTAGNEVQWYNAATAGTFLASKASAANYSVSPTVTTTYYAQSSPISCADNTLESILSNLNSNFANITSQIPSPYAFTEGTSGNYIGDGGGDMYDNGNYLSTDKSSNFSYSDNTILTSSVFGATTGRYFTRKVNNLFVLAADMNSVSWFKVNGDYGSDGGGLKSSSAFSVTVGCKTFSCFLSRVYSAGDPSINELFIIPANPSATHTGIANTSASSHTLNTITASTRMYYLLYAGSSGGLISDASAQNIATAFLTQTQAVTAVSSGCPSATRTAVTVTVSSAPTVTTDAISNIASTTATGGGNVTADGGSTVSARGVCWSTSQNPTVALSTKTTDGNGTGVFTSSITGLTAGTTYYVRAYATNAMGTNYGSQVSFAPFTLGAFANINKTFGNAPFTLVNPSSTSPGTFSYTSSNSDVATILGNTVTIVGAGTSTITAIQAASGAYASATTTCTLTVGKANQVLTLSPLPTSVPLKDFVGNLLVQASSSSALPVTITLGSGSAATLIYENSNYYLNNIGSTGTVTIVVNQAGNDDYNPAQISQSFDVVKSNQTISFAALSAVTYSPGLTSTLSASASSGIGITFAVVSGPGNITSGTQLNITGAGAIVIQASQAGNLSWNEATSVSRTLTVNKATPSITFDAISKVFDDVPFALSATSASTGAFTYSSGNTSVATISGSTATIAGVGASTLTATQAADANYLAASANATLTVGKADQTITLVAIADINLIDFEGNPIPVVVSSTSGLPVTLTLAGGSVANLNGTQLESTVATGNVTVYANQAGNTNYKAATQVSEVFAVTKAYQTITFDALPVKHVGDADFALTASSTSDLPIAYVSATPAVASLNGKIVTIHTTGSSDITASQAGNIYYNAASSVIRSQVVEGEVFKNWTGTVSTDWNVAGNWNPSGVPTITDNLVIGLTANQPHVTLSASSPALSNKLEIASGATLTLDAAKALTVNGVLTNAGTLQILSSASGTGSLITNSSISNSGTISIQRYITNDIWHLISSPVTAATALIFKDDYLQSWSESEAKWADIVLTSTGLNPAEGYGLWTTKASAHAYTFTGTPNTANQSQAISYTEVPFGENKGANLLGNPYPSSVDWSNLDDTYGAVYYWLGNGTDGDGNYVSWNNSIGTGSRYIPPMQGFFIVAESAGTFSLANSNRVHYNASPNFYKKADAVTDNLLVLETVSKGISDKLYLKFDESAEEGFELRNDAYKFLGFTDGVSELYSISGDKKLSIDVRPACDVVELGFTNTKAGEYQIGLSEVNGFNEAMLEDVHTGTFTDLLNKTYTFSYVPGEPTQRFKLHFTTILSAADKREVAAAIYSYQKTAYVNMKSDLKGDIFIYNVAGQLVATKLSAKGMNEINLRNTGNYIVKIVSDKTTQVKKIFIQ